VDIKLFKANGADDVTPTLWATLVADPYATQPFASPDSSITGESSLMMVPFSSTLD
jgi:hypothetical protein